MASLKLKKTRELVELPASKQTVVCLCVYTMTYLPNGQVECSVIC